MESGNKMTRRDALKRIGVAMAERSLQPPVFFRWPHAVTDRKNVWFSILPERATAYI